MPVERFDDIDDRFTDRMGRGANSPNRRFPFGRLRSSSWRVTGRGSSFPSKYPRAQRVTVKMHYRQHATAAKGRDSVLRHIRYLRRDNAVTLAEPGLFFNAKRDELDAKQITKSWQHDRHHFRVIVSPENGQRLGDFKGYVRSVMARVERDIGRLEWLAIEHANTDNRHAHILIRGRAADGRDLVLSRQFIAHGMREHAAMEATKRLGERTTGEVRQALAREIQAERWTNLDRTAQRYASNTDQGLRFDLKNVKLSRFAGTTQELLRQRMRFLESLGLATPVITRTARFRPHNHSWILKPDIREQLRELGNRNDVIKCLYKAMGNEAARLTGHLQNWHPAVQAKSGTRCNPRGIVVAKETAATPGSGGLIAVRDTANKIHYARVWPDQGFEAVRDRRTSRRS